MDPHIYILRRWTHIHYVSPWSEHFVFMIKHRSNRDKVASATTVSDSGCELSLTEYAHALRHLILTESWGCVNLMIFI